MKSKPPKIFVQECNPYEQDVLVAVDATKKDVMKFFAHKHANPIFTKWIKGNYDELKDLIKNKNAGFVWNDEVPGAWILFLKPLKDNWEYWETLMHEVHHIVLKLAKDKWMLEETEAQAYIFEYIFRSICRKLQGVDPI